VNPSQLEIRDVKPNQVSTRPVAVIDIGSTAIRLVILEVSSDGTYRRLDRANRPIRLGQEVFSQKVILRETLSQAIQILMGFRELMRGWAIQEDDIYVIATSAIREARNRDTFLDRVFMKTGLKVRVVEGVEENHLTFIAVQHAVESMQTSFSRSNSLILEVGGGSIELMVLKRGKMAATHSLKMGTIRIEKQMAPRAQGMTFAMEEYIREQFRVTMEGIETETSLGRVRYFIMVGGDARIVANNIGERTSEALWTLKREAFLGFVKVLQDLTVDEIVRKLSIAYHEAENLLPALLVHKVFLEETEADTIIVPNVSIREGVLLRYALGRDKKMNDQFISQVMASTRSLGKKFHIDESHAEVVSSLAIQLFDQLEKEHGMGKRERLYLQVAGILHDIGYYINASGHHKHGQYIVMNSELFGLSRNDIKIISNLIRYHRNSKPNSTHVEYTSLARDERLMVLKLSSLLRIADALDRSHTQHIEEIEAEIREDDLYLSTHFTGNITLEVYALESKAELFEEIFGYRVVLEQVHLGALHHG
jgi:exopolyphosphatase/guanosine-5'-triphosphate,3'-diphosphate pyrophosphatase